MSLEDAKQGIPDCISISHYPRIGDSITLPRNEIDVCHQIAQSRIDENRKGKKKDMLYSRDSSIDTGFRGVCGEWAFARMFGLSVYPLFDTTCRNVRNDSFDGLFKDKHFDVKTSVSKDYGCWVAPHKMYNPPTGGYVWMTMDGFRDGIFTITYRGAIQSDNIFTEDHHTWVGKYRKHFYIAKPWELREIEDIHLGIPSKPPAKRGGRRSPPKGSSISIVDESSDSDMFGSIDDW
jgi:hypothetical protein